MIGGRDFKVEPVQPRHAGPQATGLGVQALRPGDRSRARASDRIRCSSTAPYSVPVKDGVWTVQNYENRFTAGSMTLQAATDYSVNAVYARLIMLIGPEKVVRTREEHGHHHAVGRRPRDRARRAEVRRVATRDGVVLRRRSPTAACASRPAASCRSPMTGAERCLPALSRPLRRFHARQRCRPRSCFTTSSSVERATRRSSRCGPRARRALPSPTATHGSWAGQTTSRPPCGWETAQLRCR